MGFLIYMYVKYRSRGCYRVWEHMWEENIASVKSQILL